MGSVVRAAGLVVYRHFEGKTQFLLLQASYPPHHWTPPKGHVDPGEDEWVAALRETKEEAGINAADLDIDKNCHETLRYTVPDTIFSFILHIYGLRNKDSANGKPKTVQYWLARLKDPAKAAALSHEHQNQRWAELEDAVKIADYAEMGHLLRKFHAHIQNTQK